MIERIKAALNSTITWFLFLIACVLYFWRKEKHLETLLEEAKFDASIKGVKDEQAKADSVASDDLATYERLRADYLRSGSAGVRQGDSGSKETNRNS